MNAVFVTGTDTNVGKTIASACLARAWNAAYWKPVQTGTATGDDDTRSVASLAGLPPERAFTPVHAYAEPASPHYAARLEGQRIDLMDFELPETTHPLIVEGAGGLLVPLNDEHTIADLIVRLALPVVIVARSGLGTLNHTLLTLEAARARDIPVAGVILNGSPHPENRRTIEQFGRVRVLCELPTVPVTPDTIGDLARRVPPLREVLP